MKIWTFEQFGGVPVGVPQEIDAVVSKTKAIVERHKCTRYRMRLGKGQWWETRGQAVVHLRAAVEGRLAVLDREREKLLGLLRVVEEQDR